MYSQSHTGNQKFKKIMTVTEREESRFISRFLDSVTERMVIRFTDRWNRRGRMGFCFCLGVGVILNSVECEVTVRYSNGDNS